MNLRMLLRIASRIAGRVDVLRQVDSAFESLGIYPPSMNSSGKNTYKGMIDQGWDLEVEEQPDGSLKTKLNGKSMPSVLDAAKHFQQNKNKPAKPQAAPSQAVKVCGVGSAGAINYELHFYEFNGKNHERIHASWKKGSVDWVADIESNVGSAPRIHTLTEGGNPSGPAGLNSAAIDLHEIFESRAVDLKQEILDACAAANVPPWNGAKGTFHGWLMHWEHQIVNCELVFNPDAVGKESDGSDDYGADDEDEDYEDEEDED